MWKPTQHPTLLTSVLDIRWTKKAHSPDQQLVEFKFLIAWERCVARFNRALGIKADDVSGNESCLAPVAR
jgi:alkylhydroperoxidase family enzyme